MYEEAAKKADAARSCCVREDCKSEKLPKVTMCKKTEALVCKKHAKGCARRLKRRKLAQAILCEKHAKWCSRRLRRRRILPEAAVHGKTVKSESYQKQPMRGDCRKAKAAMSEGLCEKTANGESCYKRSCAREACEGVCEKVYVRRLQNSLLAVTDVDEGS